MITGKYSIVLEVLLLETHISAPGMLCPNISECYIIMSRLLAVEGRGSSPPPLAWVALWGGGGGSQVPTK